MIRHKKLVILAAFSVLLFTHVQAQIQLKWNGLYWAVGIMNMSVETKVSDKWTFNTDAVYSPWKSIDGNPMEFAQLIPEIRYFPKGAFNGFYMAAYGSGHLLIKATKWNYLNTGAYQKGHGFSLGAALGYEHLISERWGIDLYVGYGWQHSSYKGYLKSGDMYIGRNGSGEWLPYKIGAAFTYRLGKKVKVTPAQKNK